MLIKLFIIFHVVNLTVGPRPIGVNLKIFYMQRGYSIWAAQVFSSWAPQWSFTLQHVNSLIRALIGSELLGVRGLFGWEYFLQPQGVSPLASFIMPCWRTQFTNWILYGPFGSHLYNRFYAKMSWKNWACL